MTEHKITLTIDSTGALEALDAVKTALLECKKALAELTVSCADEPEFKVEADPFEMSNPDVEYLRHLMDRADKQETVSHELRQAMADGDCALSERINYMENRFLDMIESLSHRIDSKR